MGVINGGKRETLATTQTDTNGHFKLQMEVFKAAERLEIRFNELLEKTGYVYSSKSIDIAAISLKGDNKMDFTLSPTATLQIKFKNTNPIDEYDLFNFNWWTDGSASTKGILQNENCGTVIEEPKGWTGKDVCGTRTVETIAEKPTAIYWTVTKNGTTTKYSDSVYAKRDQTTGYTINY